MSWQSLAEDFCCLQDETELLNRYCRTSSTGTENSSNSQFVVFTNLHLFYLTWLIFVPQCAISLEKLRKLPSTICTRFSCWTCGPFTCHGDNKLIQCEAALSSNLGAISFLRYAFDYVRSKRETPTLWHSKFFSLT